MGQVEDAGKNLMERSLARNPPELDVNDSRGELFFSSVKAVYRVCEKKYLQLFANHFIEEETGGWDVIEKS